MRLPSAYLVTGTLRDDDRVAIYRGVRAQDRHPVLIKVLGQARRQSRDIERLQNEYEIGSQLDVSSIVRPLAFEIHEGAPVLILDDYGGEPIDELIGPLMSLERFLDLAIGLAAAVAELHARGVVHKNIKPQNILVHAETREVKLTGLELASLLPRERQAAVNPWRVEGSLPYLSPEQTGRTNQAVDHRTDLYSLGVTLYELRAGRLPFFAEDPIGWIHCHLARTPPPLSQAAPGTPIVVSDIVAKLLAKTPEARYQSARGLQLDLERCLECLVDGEIDPFPIAERDVTDRFQIPQRLYGRERELAELYSAFERVVTTGASALMLVSGFAGVGKTALVYELHKPIVRERGFFLAGKFDRYNRGIPYSTVSQAFQGRVREILTEPEERVVEWRQQLSEALGVNAQLIIEVIPEIERLIGEQPPVPTLPFDQAEGRFHVVFRRFLQVFARKEHPLTLFLDDLQWADAASLRLIEELLTADIHHLLVISAYRANEVPPSHPLNATVEVIRKAGTPVGQMFIAPLSSTHVAELVADTVRTARRETESLAALVHDTTAGNPFFTIQFLTSLHQEGFIRFDAESQSWRWSLDDIRERQFTSNVVDLMVTRLRRLPEVTRQALELASCVGSSFDSATLAMMCRRSQEQLHRDLWEAVRAGIVLRSDGAYRFLHDRVQEAAYSLIAEARRNRTHLEIGRLLLAHTASDRLPEQIFDIVSQLNRAAALMDDPGERDRGAELNLLAGQRAKAAAAYAAAAEYLASGIALLGASAWERRYELAYRLHLERAECLYLNRAFEASKSLLSLLREHARRRIDWAELHYVAIQLEQTTGGDLVRTVGEAMECLRLFGIEVPMQPTREQAKEEVAQVLAEIGDRPIESLTELPSMTDPEIKALLAVLIAAFTAAYVLDERLWAVFVCRSVRVNLKHGNTDASAVAYTSFGDVLVRCGQCRDAHRFGEVALTLVETRGLVAFRARVLVGVGLSYWVDSIENSIGYLRQAIRVGLETGNVNAACHGAGYLVSLLLTRGDALEEVQHELDKQRAFVGRARNSPMIRLCQNNQLFIDRMRGRGERDESDVERQLLPRPLLDSEHHVHMLEAHFLLGEYAEALAEAEKVRAPHWRPFGSAHEADYLFFHALALAQIGTREGLGDDERQLRFWAESCPASFADRAPLVLAEVARLDGRVLEAMRLYELAIKAAQERGVVYIEGSACELAAKFYEEQGFAAFARTYLQQARSCFARWGAQAKVAELDRRYLALASPRKPVEAATFAAEAAELDLLSVMKASQTISGAIVQDELARTLVQVVMEQGGAQRGCLILGREGELMIEAVAELDSEGVRVELVPL